MGAQPMGSPGWPELAFSTASIARNLIVLIDFSRSEASVFSSVSVRARAVPLEALKGLVAAEVFVAVAFEAALRPAKWRNAKPWVGTARVSGWLTESSLTVERFIAKELGVETPLDLSAAMAKASSFSALPKVRKDRRTCTRQPQVELVDYSTKLWHARQSSSV